MEDYQSRDSHRDGPRSRRRFLAALAAASVVGVTGCGSEAGPTATGRDGASPATAADRAGTVADSPATETGTGGATAEGRATVDPVVLSPGALQTLELAEVAREEIPADLGPETGRT